MKLHYKAPQRQLSQGFNIFIDSDCVICRNYARLCGNLRIMRSDAIFDQLCGICTIALYQRPWLLLTGVFERRVRQIYHYNSH